MPHLFVPLDQPKQYALSAIASPEHHKFWEDFNAYTYLIGGLSFIVGSVFFLPQYEDLEPVGSWIFFVASIFYLIVALHDAFELAHANGGHLNFATVDASAALNYIVGSILFMMGSVFFLPNVGIYIGGAWCFIAGSVCFTAGAVLNGLQIFDCKTKRDAQYHLMTAMCYVIGSVMFLIPSIPYLFEFETDDDESLIYTFLAAIYIAGSVCFTLGGAISFHRSHAFRKLQQALGVNNNNNNNNNNNPNNNDNKTTDGNEEDGEEEEREKDNPPAEQPPFPTSTTTSTGVEMTA